MTQPNAGDYVRLGGKSATPSASTPGSASGDDNGVSVHGTSVVQLQEEAWRARAEAARVAAEELRTCAMQVSAVLARNYFGDGCVEGTAVYEALQAALVNGPYSWYESLLVQADACTSLSNGCSNSAATLTAADSENSSTLTV
ncbi:hypothetical protein HH308_24110 [Gordonia sp. TBRC 11910]|uniref:Uncharacterized protein n=1 Tax=Gordonia asplenii TaxID=2725283 RepID=A0A848L0T4_9ACTN|nr:hypothetical protein [Gordonia asplenii]NMO04309.1 hypothetical protein [Gordonia asplenii]